MLPMKIARKPGFTLLRNKLILKSDEQLIKEIEEKIRETDYPGSSLNCGVQPIDINDEFASFYYPSENCIMKVYSPSNKKIIRNIYSRKQAIEAIN